MPYFFYIRMKKGLNVKRLLDHYTCVYKTKLIVLIGVYDNFLFRLSQYIDRFAFRHDVTSD